MTDAIRLHIATARMNALKGEGWTPDGFRGAMRVLGSKDPGKLFTLADKVARLSEQHANKEASEQWTALKVAAERGGETPFVSQVFASTVLEMIQPETVSVRQASTRKMAHEVVSRSVVAEIHPEYAMQMESLGIDAIRVGTLLDSPLFGTERTAAARVYTYMDPDGQQFYSMVRRVGPYTTRLTIVDPIGMPGALFLRGMREQLRLGLGEGDVS